jgi:head-tail adaptor
LTTAGGNDLFVYHLPQMGLKRGERASVPIMRASVPYRDIYTWDVHVKHSESYAPSGSAAHSPLVLSENKVWRQVELVNDTNVPWTTGAAMFVDGFQPLAQELLTYTSPGGICRVPVTVAVDLRGRVEDTETDRKLNDLQWQGYSYARVNGKMEIELANNKTEPVPVEVRLRFGGRADEVSDDGRVKFEMFHQDDWNNYRSDTAVNNRSIITWQTTIKPHETFKPRVTYHFFTRH